MSSPDVAAPSAQPTHPQASPSESVTVSPARDSDSSTPAATPEKAAHQGPTLQQLLSSADDQATQQVVPDVGCEATPIATDPSFASRADGSPPPGTHDLEDAEAHPPTSQGRSPNPWQHDNAQTPARRSGHRSGSAGGARQPVSDLSSLSSPASSQNASQSGGSTQRSESGGGGASGVAPPVSASTSPSQFKTYSGLQGASHEGGKLDLLRLIDPRASAARSSLSDLHASDGESVTGPVSAGALAEESSAVPSLQPAAEASAVALLLSDSDNE